VGLRNLDPGPLNARRRRDSALEWSPKERTTMSKTRRNKNEFPDKREGKKTGSRPASADGESESWDEEEEEEAEESEDEDEDGDDWEPEWPEESDDELRASGWDDDLTMMDR
jgi:hypothetical protein